LTAKMVAFIPTTAQPSLNSQPSKTSPKSIKTASATASSRWNFTAAYRHIMRGS